MNRINHRITLTAIAASLSYIPASAWAACTDVTGVSSSANSLSNCTATGSSYVNQSSTALGANSATLIVSNPVFAQSKNASTLSATANTSVNGSLVGSTLTV